MRVPLLIGLLAIGLPQLGAAQAGGVSLRYAATPRLEVLVNGLGQLSITRPNPYGGNLCGSVSAGLRYTFGSSPEPLQP